MEVGDLRRGMRGIALTVFEGTQPEPMEVEILGVLPHMLGPGSHMILARLHGTKVEHTGVVAGMSGSPVYIDGKLVGALAYRLGQFSKEPIAGITPIRSMLEINELDASAPPQLYARSALEQRAQQTGLAADPELQTYATALTPIGAPLAFSGFSEETVRVFASQFAAAGIIPVMGAGSADLNEPQPEPIEAGSSIGAVLVRGDMNIAATCTVTYVDPQRLLACGHPFLQYGMVDMPMTKSTVVATLPSPLNAFKIAKATEPVGAWVQDRHTGILGVIGREPSMIPVTLTLTGGPKPKYFRYEVLNNARLTPLAVMSTIFNALQSQNEHGEDVTYRLRGRIGVQGFSEVVLQNMYAPMDNAPTSLQLALALGERFGRIYSNPLQRAIVNGVELEVELMKDRRSATVESVRTDVTEARPGDEIVVEAVLRPYRGERIVRQIPVRIPTSTPRGTLRILVSDGDTLDRTRRLNVQAARRLDLNSTIAALNKERSNHRLYVSLLEANPQAMVEDKVMPALPLSVLNVMEGLRGSRDMVLVGESAVDESSTPFEYVVSGAQIISVTIK